MRTCFVPLNQICLNVCGLRSDRISLERICGYIPFLLKLCISMVKFIKLSILSYVLWAEFWVDGYFTQVVCYVIIEALFVPKRKIKKVYLSVFGKYHCKIKVKTIFCTLKLMLSVTSKIYSRFDTIRKYFLVFKPLLSRCKKSIPFYPVNSSLSSSAEWGMRYHS